MRKVILLCLSLCMILSFFGCAKRQTEERAEDAEPSETEILTEPTEEIEITSEQLLCATWVESFEVKDGQKYEVGDGQTLVFDQSGYVFDESGNNRGTWLLQSEVLTMDLNTYSRPQSFQIVELTPEELCFAKLSETEPELYCSIFRCSKREDFDPEQYRFNKEDLIGVWSETGNYRSENAIRINADGTGVALYDGATQYEFQWALFQGNRFCILSRGERQIMVITVLEDGYMEMADIQFVKIV